MYDTKELTDSNQAVQKQCKDVAGIQSNHKYEQYDAYPQGQTFYLTEKVKRKLAF